MSSLTLRLAESLHSHLKDIAENEGVSINQFIATAVAEKVSSLETLNYIENRAKSAKPGSINKILRKVPKRKPLSGDERG